MKETQNKVIDIEDRNIPSGLSRRSFIKRFGGGLVIAVSIADFSALSAAVTQSLPKDFNAFVKIAEDGKVFCYTGKIEMGQGVNTSLAQMIAEELDVKYEDVEMVMGDTDLCPYDRGTWGSLTTRVFGPALRSAGAEARAILLQMAAEKLGTEVADLSVNDGVISKKGSSGSITYAELTQGQKIIKSLKGKPKLKSPSEFKVIGKSRKRVDGRSKVTGGAKYAGDIRIDNLHYAKILRPPSLESKLISADLAEARGIDGVVVIEDGDLVAALHTYPEVADKALRTIKAKWDTPKNDLDENSIFDHLVKNHSYTRVNEEAGNLAKGEEASDQLIESRFLDGYVAHAPMEPHSATAVVEDGRMVVWASTQNPFGVKSELAGVLGMKEEDVLVKQAYVGGGFGGKSRNGQAVEAARLAKKSNLPVQVAWTRQEEFFYDHYRPAAVIDIKSGITQEGKIQFWDYNVYFAGSRGADVWYDIPNHQVKSYSRGRGEARVHPLNTGSWRAPGNNTNSFARESQIDIMAVKAGMDPLEFRLKNLKDPRMIRTLKACADKFGWKPIKSPSGKGYGIACGTDAGTYVAEMAEVEVDKETGEVKVIRVVCVQDMGLVINPQGATIQVEGCINMGLGYALKEDIKFKGGASSHKSFGNYDIPRFSWVPKVETVLLDLPDEPSQGGGEPAIVVVGGVLANAIYDAVGARVYQLPMTPERIKAAMV